MSAAPRDRLLITQNDLPRGEQGAPPAKFAVLKRLQVSSRKQMSYRAVI